MRNFQNSCNIKLIGLMPNFITMNYDGSSFIILKHTTLVYYRKVGKCYQIQQEQLNFISNWDIYDLMIHPYENYLGVIHKKNYKICYTNFRYSEQKNKWLIYYHRKLLDIDISLHFPLNLNLNPSLNLINTSCNQPLMEDLMGLFQLQVRQYPKILRNYKVEGEKIKYFDQKQLILSICHKKLFIYKYYHLQPLHIYNAKCNIFDITFNDEGLIFIFCSSGLIIWNLNTQKKQQLIQLDPIFKNLNIQLELYFLKGVIIFSTSDQTYYYLNLDENKEYKTIKNQKQHPKFISNAKGNNFLMLEYNKSKGRSNMLKVFELL